MILFGGIPGALVFTGSQLGITPAQIASGTPDSPLLNDIDGGDETTRLIWALLTPLVATGTTETTDDGVYRLLSPADGTWEQDYRLLAMPQTGSTYAGDSTITTIVGAATTITAVVGAASAAGLAASVSAHTAVAAGVAAAAAAELPASLQLGSSISASVGAAVAAGHAGGVYLGLSIAATVGAAVAAGHTAGVADGSAASAADVWDYVLPNGMPAGQVVAEIHTMLSELHLIHGLTLGSPLSVDATSRIAGAVSQVLGESGGTVTVTRQ